MEMKTGLKDKLKNHEVTIGSWLSIGHPAIAEIMVGAGFDWLTIDMEHSAITLHQAQELIRVIDLCGCPALVRVGGHDSTVIKRVMDAGAQGVIVPMVNSRDEAEAAVAAVKYPPRGRRGFGLARAQGYGVAFEEYRTWVEKESLVIVQIEHIRGVENLEEIMGVPGVDAFIVGPYDLSGSLGIPGQFQHHEFLVALKTIETVSKSQGFCMGYHVVPPEPELVPQKIQEGYRLVAYSVDFLLLGHTCREDAARIRLGLQEQSR
jgi:2-keto-3-deoxy-L-rhamnonate aldolase RhmA